MILTTPQRDLLIRTLAAIDCLWTPWRFAQRGGFRAAAAVEERREGFARHGVPLVVSGDDATRQGGSRDVRALVDAGLVRVVGVGKLRGVLLTDYGDDYVRSLAPTRRRDEAWWHLKRIAAVAKRRRLGTRYVLENDVVDVRDCSDDERTKRLLDFEDEVLPLLAAGWLDAYGDAVGHIGYRLTATGRAALKAGPPSPPENMPPYDSAVGNEFIEMFTAALQDRESWVPRNPSLVVIPLSAGAWS